MQQPHYITIITVEKLIPQIVSRVAKLESYYFKKHRTALKKSKKSHLNLDMDGDQLTSMEELFLYPEDTSLEYRLKPQDFLELLVEGGDYTAECLLLAYILLERFLHSTRLSGMVNFHHLLGIAALVAHKFLEETGTWFFPEFSKLSGIEACDLNKMEKLFLEGFNYNIYAKNSIWKHYLKVLVE